jgi:hypothetical protein
MATEKQCNFGQRKCFIFILLICSWLFFFLVVKLRIVGTKNIAKITKSMKMVSAAKLRGDQQRLAAGDPFSVCNHFICCVVYGFEHDVHAYFVL